MRLSSPYYYYCCCCCCSYCILYSSVVWVRLDGFTHRLTCALSRSALLAGVCVLTCLIDTWASSFLLFCISSLPPSPLPSLPRLFVGVFPKISELATNGHMMDENCGPEDFARFLRSFLPRRFFQSALWNPNSLNNIREYRVVFRKNKWTRYISTLHGGRGLNETSV